MKRGLLACNELTVRADIIWWQIRRCLSRFWEPDGEGLVVDLSQQVREHITAPAAVVLKLSGPKPAAEGARYTALIDHSAAIN